MSARNAEADGWVRLIDAPAPLRLVFLRGWCEALLGRAFPRDYDCWDLTLQHGYEYGRLEAANVRAAGLPLILLKSGSRADASLAERLATGARIRVGEAIPAQWVAA